MLMFTDELADLPPIIRAKMIRLIDKLKSNATALREPDSKSLRDGLFELRTMGTNIARCLYVYQKVRNIYLLSVFIKPGEIPMAFERLKEMLDE